MACADVYRNEIATAQETSPPTLLAEAIEMEDPPERSIVRVDRFCEDKDFICSTVCSILTFMLSYISCGISSE